VNTAVLDAICGDEYLQQLYNEVYVSVVERYPGLSQAQQTALLKALLVEIDTELRHAFAASVKHVLKRNGLAVQLDRP
jgi:hypothetical protein